MNRTQSLVSASSRSKSPSKNHKHLSDNTSLNEIAPDRDYVILGRSSVSLTEFSKQSNSSPKRIADYTLSKKRAKPKIVSEKDTPSPSPENPEKKARFKRQETTAPKTLTPLGEKISLGSESDCEKLDEAALLNCKIFLVQTLRVFFLENDFVLEFADPCGNCRKPGKLPLKFFGVW